MYGADQVGLLTGDTNINGNARVVVMTTEVLRNMLYADSSALQGLRYVVMDEVHYLADRFRGAVWEEVIIHLPARRAPRLAVAPRSPTPRSSAIGCDTVRGDTDVIVSEIRPVPLEQHVLVRGDLLPLFDDRAGIATAQVNQELMRIRSFKGPNFENNRRAQAMRSAANRSGGYEAARHRPNKGGTRPVRSANVQRIERLDRPDVVELLERANLLPAIFFIFSRVGCDAAVQQVRRSGIRLTTPEERTEIRAIVEERTRTLLDEDLAVLGYCEWLENLERGVAAHHAGLLPGVQRGRRGALPAQARQGRLRDRDPRARHQHARPHRRAREAREVQRRGARARSRRGSTPRSPVAPAGAASTSRATRSSSGPRASIRRPSPRSPRGAPTR